MSKITDVNNININGSQAIFRLKATLKAAGWTVPRSGDSITYNSSGDEITHEGSGANGISNIRAWFVIESPNGEHQWCFQRGTNDVSWRVKMSALDGFTGGTPSATQVPSATDEQIMSGSGTDASPSWTSLFDTASTFVWNVIAENAPVGTTVPIYPFWAFSVVASTVKTFIMQEAMDPDTFPELITGTRGAPVVGDPDPCIYLCENATAAFSLQNVGWPSGSEIYGWYKMNYGDEIYDDFIAAYIKGTYQCAPPVSLNSWGQNPYDGTDEGIPILIGRTASMVHSGMKGFCNHLRMKDVNRGYPSTINLATNAYVYAGDLLIPWENNATPVV